MSGMCELRLRLRGPRSVHANVACTMRSLLSPLPSSSRLHGHRSRKGACRSPAPFSGSPSWSSSSRPHAAASQAPGVVRASSAQVAAPDAAPSTSTTLHGTSAAAAAPTTQDVVAVLRARGLVQEVTSEELGKACSAGQLSVYCGFDPTADSLHLGNLLGIVVLAWFQRCGHVPVALLGGATGRVGDPSGRSSERPVLSEEQIEANVRAIGNTLGGILSRNSAALPGAPEVRVVNNLDWFGPMSFLTFLRDIGKYARVGNMLAKDSVKTRMESESGISFTEFTYQLLQGYDFVHLFKEQGVRVQVGGSDQWGNITAGTDLVRRLLGPREAPSSAPSTPSGSAPASPAQADEPLPPQCFGLTFPLLLDSEGRKFGKSTGGAIWLSPERLSPYKFYQYLFGTADADVVRFLKMLTFLSLEEVSEIEAAMAAPGYVPNTAQRRLAEEVTRFVHGEDGLQQALKATEALKPGSATKLDINTLEAVAGDAPTATLARDQVVGLPLVDLMVTVKLQPSKGQARKLIKGGGVYLNNQKVQEELMVVKEEDLIDGRMLLVAAGKKNKMLVKLQ